MKKIIIKNYTDLSDLDCLHITFQIVSQGKVSKDDTQYCAITKFAGDIIVSADITKNGTHTFTIFKTNIL